jgi:hypothetical protein
LHCQWNTGATAGLHHGAKAQAELLAACFIQLAQGRDRRYGRATFVLTGFLFIFIHILTHLFTFPLDPQRLLTLEYVGGSWAFLEKSDLTKATLQQPLSFNWIESSNG